MSDGLDGASFNKNYRVLKETSDWLSGQKEPDIDQLVPKVEAAMRAYAICKDRLDQVQATLGRYFEKGDPAAEGTTAWNGDGAGPGPRAGRPAPPVGEDGDLPD